MCLSDVYISVNCRCCTIVTVPSHSARVWSSSQVPLRSPRSRNCRPPPTNSWQRSGHSPLSEAQLAPPHDTLTRCTLPVTLCFLRPLIGCVCYLLFLQISCNVLLLGNYVPALLFVISHCVRGYANKHLFLTYYGLECQG